MLLDAHGKPVSTKILKREVAGPDVVGWRSPWTQSAPVKTNLLCDFKEVAMAPL